MIAYACAINKSGALKATDGNPANSARRLSFFLKLTQQWEPVHADLGALVAVMALSEPVGASDAAGPANEQHTLYVGNLPEKLSIEDLKLALHAMFDQFGPLLDIVASDAYRLRGQAWLVFEDAAHAAAAMRDMQSFPFYNKPLKIALAKTKSDAIAKKEGTFHADSEARRAHHKEATSAHLARVKARHESAAQAMAAGLMPHYGMPVPGMPPGMMHGGPPGRVPFVPGMGPRPGGLVPQILAPNKILFVENIAAGTSEAQLVTLFKQSPGFVEVRLIPNRPEICFVEYENEAASAAALSTLDAFKLQPEAPLKLSFAKQ